MLRSRVYATVPCIRNGNPGPDEPPGLCDEMSGELGCEMPRDSTNGRRRSHPLPRASAIRRFTTISVRFRLELRCDAPQVQGCYADRASPRPNSS